MVDLTALGAFGSAMPGGYMSAQQRLAQIKAAQLQNQDTQDLRAASLASMFDSQGMDPTTATIMALSGMGQAQPPSAVGAMSPAPSMQQPAAAPQMPMGGAPPSAGDMPAGPGGAPQPSPMQPPPMMPPQGGMGAPQSAMRPAGMPPMIPGMGGGQMSLGQMFQKLRADPRNQGIPDATLFGLAAKAQQSLMAPDRIMLEYMMKNMITPYQKAQLAQGDQRIFDAARAHQDAEADRRERMRLTEELTAGAQLSDDDAKFLAQQRLAGDKSALSGLGYGNMGAINRRRVNTAMREIIQSKYGDAGGEFVARMTAAYMGDQAAIKSLATQAARVDSAAIEMKKFAPLVLQTSAAIDRTQFPTINALQLAAQKGTGGTEVIRLIDSINAFKNAYAQVVSRGGASSVDARQRADEVIDKKWSDGQIQAAIDQLTMEANKAIESMREARQSVLGDIGGGMGGGSGVSGGGGGPVAQPAGGSQQKPTVSNW